MLQHLPNENSFLGFDKCYNLLFIKTKKYKLRSGKCDEVALNFIDHYLFYLL